MTASACKKRSMPPTPKRPTSAGKLHMPDWLVAEAWQTFARMRTIHLTAVF